MAGAGRSPGPQTRPGHGSDHLDKSWESAFFLKLYHQLSALQFYSYAKRRVELDQGSANFCILGFTGHLWSLSHSHFSFFFPATTP